MATTIIDAPDKELNKDAILDILNDETEKEEEKPDELAPPIVEEEEKPADENEEVIEEEPEIKDELEFFNVPRRQELLKEYPEIFKKHPGLESALYREQQYAELFTTPTDAKAAVEDQKTFKEFESELLNGNLESVLVSVKKTDDKAFAKMTSSILQTLQKVDQGAYVNTVNHVLKQSLKATFDHGKSVGGEEGEQLQIAAQLLHKFIYGKHEIDVVSAVNTEEKPSERETEFTRREMAAKQQQFTSAVEDITTRTDNAIKNHLEKTLDTKGVMTPYVKSKAIDDILAKIKSDISSDARLKGILGKLWEESAKANFSDDSKTRIRKALLAKVQTIIQPITQRVKADALKGQTSRKAKEISDEKPIERGRPATTPKKSEIGKKESTLDFFNRD